MSEVDTPADAPESTPVEEGDGGGEETGLFAGGESPGLDTETPEQQAAAPPEEQAQAPEQQADETTQQPIPAKEDESRFEYHQSRASQYERELDELKGGQTYAIAQYIQQNPEMLDIVEDGMRGGQLTRSQGIPERPVRPQKPKNYDSSEAHDPETVSGRYRADFDDYLEQKDIYADAREAQAEISEKRNADKAAITTLRTGLVREGGLSEIEADEAMALFNSAASRDPVSLVKFYRVLKAPSQDENANQEKLKHLISKKNGLKAPPPLATVTGESPPPTTPEEDFRAAMQAGAELGGSLV